MWNTRIKSTLAYFSLLPVAPLPPPPSISLSLYFVYMLCMNAPLKWKVLNTRIMPSLCFYSTSKLALLSMRVKCSTYYTRTHTLPNACITMKFKKITSEANVFCWETTKSKIKWGKKWFSISALRNKKKNKRPQRQCEDSEKEMLLFSQIFQSISSINFVHLDPSLL